MKRGELGRDPEKLRDFQRRGRESSARSLGMSAREAARNLQHNARTAGRRISPASKEQRAAVDGLVCLGCGEPASSSRVIDPAHVIARGRGGCDDALCVVPLCRTFDGGCHRRYDEGTSDARLDLLRIIAQPDKWEQWRAHAQHALEHCTPNELLERLTGQRTQWSDAGEVVYIARCPEHGLHGERDECFVCHGPVERVPMQPAQGSLS